MRVWPAPGAALLLAALITLAGCGGNQSMLNPQGPAARSIAGLAWTLFAITGVVYVAVMVALGIALFRRRHETDDSPGVASMLTRRVAIASVATVVVLVGLAIATFAASRGLSSPSGPGAVTVDVIGHQWWWEFRYDDVSPQDVVTSPNELRIPAGVPVVLRASSRDVIHSFWVPNLHGKRDLIPGMVTHTWIRADQPGVYRGQCGEFCGHQHARMAFVVVAEAVDDFEAWIRGQRMPAQELSSGSAIAALQRGRDLFMQGTCATCHTIRGTSAGGRLGPDLTHVGSRMTIAAGTLPNTRESLARWIVDAQSIKPGSRMPSVPMPEGDQAALVTYLRSLR